MNATDAFFDTNVLLYAVSDEAAKAARAEELLRQGGVVSVQVLAEFVDVARRKHGSAWGDVLGALDLVRELCGVVDASVETLALAVELSQRHRFRIYDSMIVAAAIRSGAKTLFSEDMQDGQTIGSVTIRNPFAGL
jgi:predicted nucleic acid-binding protein